MSTPEIVDPGASLGRERGAPVRHGAPLWATVLARLMDDVFRIPGTNRRIGLDAILGFLLPGAGDVLSAGSGVVLILLAFSVGVPGVVIARIAMNVAIDAVVGSIPILGDWFDVRFKSNQINLELIERFQSPGEKAGPGDYAIVIGCLALVGVALLVPLFAVGWIVAHALRGRGL